MSSLITEKDITKENRVHYKFSHYSTINGEYVKMFVPKRSFLTEKDALNTCRKINLNPNNFRKSVIYKCNICGNWHIGHNSTMLTEKERNKIQKQIRLGSGV